MRLVHRCALVIVVILALAATPLLIVSKGTIVPAFSSGWLGVPALVIAGLSALDRKLDAWSSTTRVILFVIATVLGWTSMVCAVEAWVRTFSSVMASEHATLIDYKEKRKISNCTEAAYVALSGTTYRLCANNIPSRGAGLEPGASVVLRGRTGLGGFAVDELIVEPNME